MAEVICYLLLLNHPENLDFSGNTGFKSIDCNVGLFTSSYLSIVSQNLYEFKKVIVQKENPVKCSH